MCLNKIHNTKTVDREECRLWNRNSLGLVIFQSSYERSSIVCQTIEENYLWARVCPSLLVNMTFSAQDRESSLLIVCWPYQYCLRLLLFSCICLRKWWLLKIRFSSTPESTSSSAWDNAHALGKLDSVRKDGLQDTHTLLGPLATVHSVSGLDSMVQTDLPQTCVSKGNSQKKVLCCDLGKMRTRWIEIGTSCFIRCVMLVGWLALAFRE